MTPSKPCWQPHCSTIMLIVFCQWFEETRAVADGLDNLPEGLKRNIWVFAGSGHGNQNPYVCKLSAQFSAATALPATLNGRPQWPNFGILGVCFWHLADIDFTAEHVR
jgi:hypothetical protein